MLPLWIIDICKQSDRSRELRESISKLRGVLFRDEATAFLNNAADDSQPLEEEKLWFYTRFDDPFGGMVDPDDDDCAQRLYEFQEAMVGQGQVFVSMLRRCGVRQDRTLNVCVLADSTEGPSQMLFPSIATMLQKEKGRLVPGHIHQGMAIIGALFVPADLNSRDVVMRQKVLQVFRELRVQHNISTSRGYDHIMLWQDIQNRTELFYRQFGAKGQAEYLTQCLVHLYYACNELHPLISGSSSDDRFYFTLGASSIFFDMSVQDEIDRAHVANHILKAFKEAGDLEEADDMTALIPEQDIAIDRMLCNFDLISVDLSQVDVPEPSPHPVADFADNDLKRYYYHYYLKLFPANLKARMLKAVDDGCRATLEAINANGNKMMRNFEEVTLPNAIKKQLASATSDTGALQRVMKNLARLKERLGSMKSGMSNVVEEIVWRPLRDNEVPRNLRDTFDSYHDAYVRDNESPSPKSQTAEMKKNAMDSLVATLRHEATTSSRIVSAVLMGVMAVLTVVPFLQLISPDIVNLGNVKARSDIWAAVIFLIPAFVQFLFAWLYWRKRERAVRRLKACYLHDAFARIAARLQAEASYFYDKAMALCDEYDKRCKDIVADVKPYDEDEALSKLEIPLSRFNQPAIDGKFGNRPIMPGSSAEEMKININRLPCPISELDRHDFFSLIRLFNEQMFSLFRGVRTPDSRPRKFDDKLGQEVYVSLAEAQEERAQVWKSVVEGFRPQLLECVGREMLPREYPSVGEMIRQYAIRKQRKDVLLPVIESAASSGEFTTSADVECADVKVGVGAEYIRELVSTFLPRNTTALQTDETNELYSHYLFVSRWRTFDDIAYNRILPKEDFDLEVYRRQVSKEEQKIDEEQSATPNRSSLILWATCRDDQSSEWLELFDGAHLSTVMERRAHYLKRMMHND